MEDNLKQEFTKIIKSDKELIRLLKIVRNLNLNDSYIGAGAVRNLIWDYRHNYKKRTKLNDIDVIYFDGSNLESKKDSKIEEQLSKTEPKYEWNVFNQARAHLKTPNRTPAKCSEDGMRYWHETATGIGVRLNKNNTITICAPNGLSDLMNLIIRPVPEPYQDIKTYKQRLDKKGWKKIWPKLTIKEE